MPRFTSHDGTTLAYRVSGDGDPLLCVPGRAGSYLGDLGGLSEHRTLVVLDNRGTGDSAAPATYRRDRLADDVEALRAHPGLDRVDLLAYAAGADPVSPASLCRDLAALIPASTYVEHPGVGHFPWVDDPDGTVARLTAWT